MVVLSSAPSVALTIVTWLFKAKSKTYAAIKRNIYIRLAYRIKNERKMRLNKWLSSVVYVFYRYPRKNIPEQQAITSDLLKTITNIPNADTPKIFWIEGESFSGKTTAILNFFIDLVSNSDYQNLFAKLDGKILYFDAGRDTFNLQQIYIDYCNNKFERDLLVFDNLHKLSGKELLEMLKKLAESVHALAIVFCIRHPEEFISENEKVRQLKSVISSVGKQYTLPLIDYNKHEFYQNREFAIFFQALNIYEENFFRNYGNYFIVHLASLYTRNERDIDTIDKIKNYLTGVSCDKDFSKVFITLICSSLFTGSFSKKMIRIANTELSGRFIHKTLESLVDLGFIGEFPNGDNDYYCFNEKVAHFYFERGFRNVSLQKLYKHNFLVLSDYHYEQENLPLTFLYSLIINSEHDQHILFKQLAVNINFVNLYDEMRFLLGFSEQQEEEYATELGILCDRKGSIKEARKYYLKDLQKSKQPDSLYRLIQMDHGMYKNSKYNELICASLVSDDIFTKVLAHYWRSHINMHQGIFNLTEFETIVEMCSRHHTKIYVQQRYDGIHLLRRIYFDYFRMYYLSGELSPEKLVTYIENTRELSRLLSLNLDEFNAYYLKFAVGLLLGKDLLFDLVINNKCISEKEYNVLIKPYCEPLYSLAYCDMRDARKICSAGIVVLERVVEQMNSIGDKTAIFVNYHIHELKMSLVTDENYIECEAFGERYRSFAFEESVIEYKIYAELFQLKLDLNRFTSPSVIVSYGDDEYDYLQSAIQERFSILEGLIHAQQYYTNTYAKLSLKIYKVLFLYFIKQYTSVTARKELEEIKSQALALGYKREVNLILFIENRKFTLSAANVRKLFMYYPIVPQ